MNELAALCFGVIVYIYFGYFLFLALAGGVASLFRREKRYASSEELPSMTLMIAAYNEERDIRSKLENSLQLKYPEGKLEIVVVSDGSSDRTDEIVKEFAGRGVKLRRVEGRVGKTQARNIVMRETKTELVLFSDATTMYRPDLALKMAKRFADKNVGMVTGQLIYKDPAGAQMGAGQKLFWKYESFLKKCQSSLGTLTGSVGCATAFRREDYTELPPNIIEDFTEPLMMVLKGKRVVYEANAICSELTTIKASQEWKMRVRVIRGGITGLLYAKRLLNPFHFPFASFQLISHKLLRWLAPIFAIVLLLASSLAMADGSANGFTAFLFYGQVIFYGIICFCLANRSKEIPKIFAIPYYLFIVNAASLTAIFKTFTVPLEETWETERSSI